MPEQTIGGDEMLGKLAYTLAGAMFVITLVIVGWRMGHESATAKTLVAADPSLTATAAETTDVEEAPVNADEVPPATEALGELLSIEFMSEFIKNGDAFACAQLQQAKNNLEMLENNSGVMPADDQREAIIVLQQNIAHAQRLLSYSGTTCEAQDGGK